jgi:hypothetical protein
MSMESRESKFRPYTAAILAGAVGMPLFVFIADYISRRTNSDFLLFLWLISGFFLPVIISTVDVGNELKFFRAWLQKEGIRGVFIIPPEHRLSKDALRKYYIPVWKRMAAWFVSACVSMFVLKLVGINVG